MLCSVICNEKPHWKLRERGWDESKGENCTGWLEYCYKYIYSITLEINNDPAVERKKENFRELWANSCILLKKKKSEEKIMNFFIKWKLFQFYDAKIWFWKLFNFFISRWKVFFFFLHYFSFSSFRAILFKLHAISRNIFRWRAKIEFN